jgi:uncharacterized protein (DUF2236 family)
LNLVRASAVSSRSGIFGAQSAIWHIDREAAIFLGAGRALLLQLAHPWVAAAIDEHSNTFTDPIGRFHRTFGIVFNMVFGSLEDSLAVARQLHRRHSAIKGSLLSTAGPYAAGSAYFANSVPALRWVWATLTDTAYLTYRLVLPRHHASCAIDTTLTTGCLRHCLESRRRNSRRTGRPFRLTLRT